MNKTAIKKHEIYGKLSEFTEQELNSIVDYIDYMRQKKKLSSGHIIKLQGVLKGHDIVFADLKKLKEDTWKHVEEEHE
ncbi:MAG TPA: hypothetical protein ENN05_03830 [Deltaproteobacteria bacterium]|nr:hypothetical protein [Deltaproteobacteria bacterium]